MLKPIAREAFNKLVRGARVVGRNEGGVTYECRNGVIATQYHDGTNWNYAVAV